jgi:uncharacterized membrane protein YfcA
VDQPLAWLTYQSGWTGWDSSIIAFLVSGSDGYMFVADWQYLDIMISALLLIIFSFLLLKLFNRKEVDKALPVFSFTMIIVPFLSGSFISLARYMIVVFPVFFLLADYSQRSNITNRLMLFSSSILLIIYTILFHNWYWVG